MGKLLLDLSDEERAGLERVRVKLGLRSHVATVRALIAAADVVEVAAVAAPVAAPQARPVVVERPKARPFVQHPKPGKRK